MKDEKIPLTPIVPSLDVFSFDNNDEEDEERTLEDYNNEELLEELRRRLIECEEVDPWLETS